METKSRVGRTGGGVAIFIKFGIAYVRIENIPDDLEGLTIRLKTSGSDITITNLYIPPTGNVDYEQLKQVMSPRNLLICGERQKFDLGFATN